jgi:hypothetical protein
VHTQCLNYYRSSQLFGRARYIAGILFHPPGIARRFWCGDGGRPASRMLGSWIVQKAGAS